MFNFYDYNVNFELRHQITLDELETKIGKNRIFEGSNVDDVTKDEILDYFRFDRLCDEEKRFLWYLKRNLRKYYPIYKDEIEMWASRKALEWFFDNYKDEIHTHDGTFELDENDKKQITHELERIINDVFDGTITNNGKTNSKQDDVTHSEGTGKDTGTNSGTSRDTTHEEGSQNGNGSQSGTSSDTTHEEGETTDSYTDNDNAKRRGFSFVYPESNYSGGVIPYDLDSNPSVEFISTQNDGIEKSTKTHNGTGTSENDSESNGTTSSNYENESTNENDVERNGTTSGEYESNREESTDGTASRVGEETKTNTQKTDNTDDSTTNETSKDNEDDTRKQNTKTNWTETIRRQGDNINKLSMELIEELPTTNFFETFMNKLSICFQKTYIEDELLEEREDYGL